MSVSSRLPRALAVLVIALVPAAPAASAASATSATSAAVLQTDREREIAALDLRIAALRTSRGVEGETRAPASPDLGPGRLAFALVQRASLSGDFRDFKAAEDALAEAERALGPMDDLVLLVAQLEVKVHRLDAAERQLDRFVKTDDLEAPEAHELPEVSALRADIAVQRGRYAEAEAAYRRLLVGSRSWDLLARLAYLESKTGRSDDARRLYAEAADLLTAKEMRHYSWLELQRGLLELEERKLGPALAHFERAERAFSGDRQVGAHRAETLALLGRVDEAIALDRELLARTTDPEVANDLALLLAARQPAESARLLALADREFEARRSLFPEAATGHWIEARLARCARLARLGSSAAGGGEALLAARGLIPEAEAAFRLRPYGLPGEQLVETYLRSGEGDRARALLARIEASGWSTPSLGRLRRPVRGAPHGGGEAATEIERAARR